MRQAIPSNVWTILKDWPNQQVLQDSGETVFIWPDNSGNIVLQALNPEHTWAMREYVNGSWEYKE